MLARCTFLFALALMPMLLLQAQNLPCGSPAYKSEWLREYQRRPVQDRLSEHQNRRNARTTTYLPMTFHLVGRTDSGGVVSLESVLASFCQLNEDYAGSGIQFYIEFPIRYHYNTAWYSHSEVRDGGLMMLQENVANTINVYFVASPAGNCGYNLPYAGVAMNNGCLSGHTFAHELGHALGMPHTFFGWEGGQSWDGSVPPVYDQPAPITVTYNYTDFKDTMWSADTLIIDTAYVENVPRTGTQSNCDFAADGFCDTEADYLAYRWLCSSTNAMSSVLQTDPNGMTFNSNGEYIMSYAYDDCQTGFTAEQIAGMNAFIQDRRQSYLYNQNPNALPVTGQPTPLSPAAAAIVPETQVTFTWQPLTNATHYYIELYREPYAANTLIYRGIVADTFYTHAANLPPRNPNFPYAWRVLGFNQGSSCGWFSNPINFNTSAVVSTAELPKDAPTLRIFPNPAQVADGFTLEAFAPAAMSGKLQLHNAIGQLIYTQTLRLEAGDNQYQISGNNAWAEGWYFLSWQSAEGQHRHTEAIFMKN